MAAGAATPTLPRAHSARGAWTGARGPGDGAEWMGGISHEQRAGGDRTTCPLVGIRLGGLPI